jgi:hypothetical protein
MFAGVITRNRNAARTLLNGSVAKLFPRMLAPVLLGASFILGTNLAHAEDKVYSPTVERGEVELEMRAHTTFDSDPGKDDQQQYKFEAGYGIADKWFTAIGSTVAKDATGDLQNQEVFWENIIQLTEQGEHWVDAGLYLEYAVARGAGTPNELEGKLLLEKSVGNFLHTANLVFVREVGNGAANATNFEYAWRSKYFISRALEVGIELYGEMGEFGHVLPSNQQDHRIGPVISGKLGQSKYELGYLFGASDAAPNGTLKFNIEYEFRL